VRNQVPACAEDGRMNRHVWWPRVVGAIGLFLLNGLAGGCTPGPVSARSAGDRTTGAGNTGGSDARLVGRDAASVETDGASGPRGAGGASARMTIDGALPADRAPSEIPDPPVRDGTAADARMDASRDASVDVSRARMPRPGEVAIDELLVNPTGDDLGREWIELANRASEPLDLSQLHLATVSTDVAVAAGTIAPGALLLLGQSSDPTKNGGAPVAVAYGTKLILLNANGQLSLCLGACASGVAIDAVSWGALGDDQTGHALIVDPATKGLCSASTPFGTAGSFGTPGAPNPPCLESVDGGSRADVSVAD
jgi:hypothetical protein